MAFFLLTSCSTSNRVAQKIYDKNIKDQPFDAIIVPGFPYYETGWDTVLNIRIRWADYLYKKGYAKNIIFSGSAVYTKYVESKVMAIYAEALGIPPEHIFTEQTAEHTTENVYYSYRIAKKHGFTNIGLATDPNQVGNMRHFINKYELPIKLLPIVYDTLRANEIQEPVIDASPAIRENFVSIVERQSLYHRIRGTFGKYIKWHSEDLKKKRFKRRYKDRIVYD
ncbi:MAG TPA: YdcF family protein [Bacteroidia bacterium]|nr:YdcF family protein [Bacteroidia bacterium]